MSRMFTSIAVATLFAILSAQSASSCVRHRGPDLHEALKSDLVASARISAIRELKAETVQQPGLAIVTFRNATMHRGAAARAFDVIMRGWSYDTFTQKYQRGSGLTFAVRRDRDGRSQTGESGNPLYVFPQVCGGALVFEWNTPQARAIELMFDGEGDPEAEAELFNKLFLYAQGGGLR